MGETASGGALGKTQAVGLPVESSEADRVHSACGHPLFSAPSPGTAAAGRYVYLDGADVVPS